MNSVVSGIVEPDAYRIFNNRNTVRIGTLESDVEDMLPAQIALIRRR